MCVYCYIYKNFTNVLMATSYMKMTLFCSQDIESDKLSDHLAVLADSLSKAKKLIYPPVRKQSKLAENLNGLIETVSKEHRRLLARKSIIEKRKEEHERQMLEMVCDISLSYQEWCSLLEFKLIFSFEPFEGTRRRI